MTLSLYLQIGLMGIIGILIQVIIKLQKLQTQATAANMPFQPMKYFKTDWLSLTLSLLTLFACIFCLDEFAKWKPALLQYVKVVFIAVGYMGASVMSFLLNKTEKNIISVIDKKTNIADNIQ